MLPNKTAPAPKYTAKEYINSSKLLPNQTRSISTDRPILARDETVRPLPKRSPSLRITSSEYTRTEKIIGLFPPGIGNKNGSSTASLAARQGLLPSQGLHDAQSHDTLTTATGGLRRQVPASSSLGSYSPGSLAESITASDTESPSQYHSQGLSCSNSPESHDFPTENHLQPLIHSATVTSPPQPLLACRTQQYKTGLARANALTSARTVIRTLGSLDSPALEKGSDSRPRRYRTLHGLDDLEGDKVDVDISSLEGPEIWKLNDLKSDHQSKGLQEPGFIADDGRETACGVGESLSLILASTLTSHPKHDLEGGGVKRMKEQPVGCKTAVVSVKDVSPAVDLSLLEGSGRLESSVFDPEEQESPTPDMVMQDFCYRIDPEQPNWKPASMRSLYIIMLIVISLTLAAVQECLFQKSQSLEKAGSGLIGYNNMAELSLANFFCWKYLPTMVMVGFGVLWQIMEYQVKRLEPYYQLSRATGNTAAESINLDYVTLWAYYVPFKAVRYRHWAVTVASFGSVLATTVAPSLQNPSMTSILNPYCYNNDCSGKKKYIVIIHPVWSRLLTVALIGVGILAVILLLQLRRKSGLLSDPRGIAGIASMATKSHILTDFQGMDEARLDQIHNRLQHRRYVLYKSTIWQGEYIRHTERDRFAERNVQNPHPIILRLGPAISFILFMTLCFVSIPVVTYTGASVVPTRVPWLPVLVAAVIKQLWTTLEFAVKMIEPFYILSKGDARPEATLTLDYQGVPYGFLPYKAIFKRHYVVALVGLGSILGDILTVTASSLSLTHETEQSFRSSSTLATIITAFLIISATIVLARRRHPFLPRQPSTIASILAFIYQSRMLDDFVGTERFSNVEMERMLISKNKRYGLGWFRGRDKRPHCAVDEEPMLSKYVHGVSYIRAQAPWEEDVGV